MKKKVEILTADTTHVKTLCKELGCTPVIASILVNRHIHLSQEAHHFLHATLKDIRPPFSIKDMDVGVERICSAITQNQKILIFGDYDVDGITATALLYEFLTEIGVDVSYYIPHRTREGYGLKDDHIFNYAVSNEIDLIITVDCGIGSHKAVDAANSAGIDVIITDHHIPGPELPPAQAVINPKRSDCTAGFQNLAGVGVVYCLLICLRKGLRDREFWGNRPEPNLKAICDLVALGTVGDMVPLVKENRIFSKTGLAVINRGRRFGIAALAQISGIKKGYADAEDIAFRLAPRLNAAGRIKHAHAAVSLLITDKITEAREIGWSLHAMNTFRQGTEKKILSHIHHHLAENSELLAKRTIVLSHPDWHMGVLGIVASRIVKKYFRPTILISTKDGEGRGSGRSIPGFDIHSGLGVCADYLIDFGGHAMAVGLTLNMGDIHRFQNAFEQVVVKMTTPTDFIPKVIIDYLLDIDDISPMFIDDLEQLKPFGVDNPQPLFMARDVDVISTKIVGKYHRRMVVGQHHSKTGKTIDAIQFNIDPDHRPPVYFEQVVFRVVWNYWNDKKSTQIIIEDV